MILPRNGQRLITTVCAVAVVSMVWFGQGGIAQSSVDCALSPLTLPLFGATPVAIVASTPVAMASTANVDEAVITTAMEMIVTCANSADPAIANSIFTERYLASLFLDPSTYLPAFEQELDNASSQVVGTLMLDEIVSFTVRSDGRIEVVARLHNASESYTDTFVLVYVGGAWLIDDVTNLDPLP